MIGLVFWMICVGAAAFTAARRGLSVVGYTLLAVFLGPLAWLIALAAAPPGGREAAVSSWTEARRRLEDLRAQVSVLQRRIEAMERSLAEREDPSGPGEVSASPFPRETVRSSDTAGPPPLETILGRYWLSRLGVVFVVVGVAFFLSRTFVLLGPWLKVMAGYALAGSLFALGRRLEGTDRYARIGPVIRSGGWAMMYVTTYALHYLPAVRIVAAPGPVLILLAGISAAVVLDTLRSPSERMTSVSFVPAFLTVGIGGVGPVSIGSWILLHGAVVFLACRRRMAGFLLTMMAASYGTHVLGFSPLCRLGGLSARGPWGILLGLLVIAWAAFSIGLLTLARRGDSPRSLLDLGALGNAAAFILSALPLVERIGVIIGYRYANAFWFLVLMALVYGALSGIARIAGAARQVSVYASVGLTLLAMAVWEDGRYLVFWGWETALFFVLGVFYREPLYRILGALLAAVTFLWALGADEGGVVWTGFGLSVTDGFLRVLWVIGVLCGIALAAARPVLRERLSSGEIWVYDAFAVGGAILLWSLAREIPHRWITLFWGIGGSVLLAAGISARYKVLRVCALWLWGFAAARLLSVDLAFLDVRTKGVLFVSLGILLVAGAFLYSRFLDR